MSEFVRKNALGIYKEVQGGQSDPECTHVILKKDEYENLLYKIRMAEQETRNAKSDAEKKIKKINTDSEYKISHAEETAKNQVEEIEQELRLAEKEIEYQKELNKTLLRISKERANADRKLKPKKEHSGYVVTASSEKEYSFKDGRKLRKILLWETVLQSPFVIDFTEEQARKQIFENLFAKDEDGKWLIEKIGINANYAAGFAKMLDNEEWKREYKHYNVMLERKLRMNFRSGYWEISFLHTKPLLCVPKEMRAC